MMTALLAARNILGLGSFDTWKVNTDAEYHEEAAEETAGAVVRCRVRSRRPDQFATDRPALSSHRAANPRASGSDAASPSRPIAPAVPVGLWLVWAG